MKRFLTAIACVFALTSFAYHIQVGASGYSQHFRQWLCDGIDIGATPQRVSQAVAAHWGVSEIDNFQYNSSFYIGKRLKEPESSYTNPEFLYLHFPDNGGTTWWASTRSDYHDSMYGSVAFTASKSGYFGFIGYSNAYTDYRWKDAEISFRGNPYSVVLNDTSSTLTINGTQFASGEAKSLFLPNYLVMAELENAKFYDLDTNARITPCPQSSYSQQEYSNGKYFLRWTGNIRVTDDTSPTNNVPDEGLVYGDIESVNEYKLLYADNGENANKLIREEFIDVTTNIQVMTWWDFTQSEWGDSPQAYINGVCVCSGHSTSHIISYTVSEEIKVNPMSGKGYAYFTMSQTPQSGKSGGSCVFKCWDASAGSGTSGWGNADPTKRAAISGGVGTVARFKITVNIYTGVWTLTAM